VVDRLLGRAKEREVAPQPEAPGDPRDAVWARVLLARNAKRPHTLELVAGIADRFTELHGDRLFGDDGAIVGGLARIDGRRVVIVGHQKGADTDENIRRNFGMGKPEGFRKAIRLFELADRFRIPVVTFVDTPGAYPGIDSEERGIAEAIARNLLEMSRLRTPILAVVTGEGGSGGALGIGLADVVLMLEHSVYSVISPEGCAAILWKNQSKAKEAAEAMRLTAADCKALGVVDEVIPEPSGGAHSDPVAAIELVGRRLHDHLDRLRRVAVGELLETRYRKFRAMGAWEEASSDR